MSIAPPITKLTFEEYIHYNDGTDTRYELVNGELIPMSLAEGLHGAIMKFLEQQFDSEISRLGHQWTAQRAAVGVRSPRAGRWDTSRIPDIVVIPKEQWRSLRNREAIIELNEPPPILVVEVISESTKTTDYRAKRVEYNVLEIPEYVTVDPLDPKVTVFNLIDDLYESQEFFGSDPVTLKTFPELRLTVEQILAAE
jgi:Uma2 family endonuclease